MNLNLFVMAKKESNYKIVEKINVINEPTTVYQLKTDSDIDDAEAKSQNN